LKKWIEVVDRRSPAFGACLCLAAALGACNCTPDRQAASRPRGADQAPLSQGTITASLHRYVESSAAEPFEQFSITALFPRYGRAAKDLVDGLIEGRVPELYVALDQCVAPVPSVRQRTRRVSDAEGTAVELADVGDLSIETDGRKAMLPTQTFPDLLRAIDGVTYAANDEMGVAFSPSATYTIHAAGTDEISSFDVVLDAPEDLGEITVDGVSPAEQVPVIRRGEPLELTWESGGGYGDEVFAKISWSGMGLPLSMDCRMRDDGQFTVPGDMTAAMRDPLAAGEAEMTVSRVRQTAFRAKGLDSGEFSFVLSTSFLVRFENVP
jgi:hypothetical protein